MNRASRKRQAPRARRRSQAPSAAPPEAAPPATQEELLELLLQRIARGGALCREVERQLQQHPCPELETIIKLYRTLALSFSGEAVDAPEKLKLVSALMKPVLEWAWLEEKRKQRELGEQKYHDQQAALQAEKSGAVGPKVLAPKTLDQIEHELHLF